MAHRGIYASYTNTIVPEGAGAYPSIHNRFSVQDKEGFSYFPAGVTVGPGYILPEAFILKIFGDGLWQYRLWPLLTYTALLIVLFSITWFLGGWIALIIFQFWLWMLPQLFINFAYESYSESIALLFLLLSFILFFKGSQKEKSNIYYLASGLLFSFSFLTKYLFLLTGLAFLPLIIWGAYHHQKKIKTFFIKWTSFTVGFIIPILGFELYRYIFLATHFGISAWEANNKDLFLTLKSGGSGIDAYFSNLYLSRVIAKLSVWSHIGIYNILLTWFLLFAYPLIIGKLISKKLQLLSWLLFSAATLSFLWFLSLSTDGWGRHVWQGLIIAMMLFSITIGLTLKSKLPSYFLKLLCVLVLILFLLPVLTLKKAESKFFLDKSTITKWQESRWENGQLGFPPLPIFPLKDQQEIITFFSQNIKEKDRIYYQGSLLVAELPPLVDKVFYPLDRYALGQYKNRSSALSFLILGPYQKGSLKIVPDSYLESISSTYCQKVVFTNPSYQLCLLRSI